ncbi:heavy metal translocating P-type ATPase [Hyphomonas oceanitis]|uniref:heavy metal translocating P-type ATPase n=1 Tax=Hyphomonas oceanitis TaxID=81033 RepID=UPI003002E52F
MSLLDTNMVAGCPSGLAPSEAQSLSDPSAFVRRVDGQNRLSLTVRGAKCGACINRIESAVKTLPGMESARLNLSTGDLEVGWRGSLKAPTIVAAVAELGYGVSPRDQDQGASDEQREERSLLIALGVAGFAMANIMLLSVSIWAGVGEMGETTRTMLHGISGVIALPAIIFSGRVFFVSAWNVLKRGHANMDVPISLALVIAFCVSVSETLRGGADAYFDASVMLLFFLLIGRFLDARVRRKAHASARDLAAMAHRTVMRLGPNGKASSVRASEISPGDQILLAPGERAVVDIQIDRGISDIDESLVTGESLARRATPGMHLLAGTVNLSQPLTGTALAAASDSLLADIARMLEAGEQRRSTYRRIADRAVSLYVPFVHTSALLAFMGWLLAGMGVNEALLIGVSTLIITCPCALALAAPVTQVVAAGRLFRSGTFLKSGDALERIAQCDYIIFDKTGTLTLGTPKLSGQISPEALQAAAELARASRHPLSRAIVEAAGAGPVASDAREFAGLGLEGIVHGAPARLGSAEWVSVDSGQSDRSSLWFSQAGKTPVHFQFQDHVLNDAATTIGRLQKAGYGVEIVSGDRSETVESVAQTLKVDHWSAAASPRDKVNRLEELQAQGHKVLMVGDGLNDAGALALAHASLAPGGAMDVSQSASDAIYSGGLAALPRLISVAKQARSVMIENFAFAAAYNVIAVPIAITGHATPLVAAVAMSASSILVSLNALRLNAMRETL